MCSIEEQIQFIKSKSDSGLLSDMYTSILESLMKVKKQDEAEPMMDLLPHQIFIDKMRTSLLKIDGFTRGRDKHIDDSYSEAKNQPIYYKRLGTKEYSEYIEYWTTIITKNEIAIEVQYDYGGGYSGGLWEYEKGDAKSFIEAYKLMIEKVEKEELTPPKHEE